MDGLSLPTTEKKLLFTTVIKTAVAAILKIDMSAVSVYSTFVSARRRLTEVSDSRNLHGAQAGINAVYLVTMSGTTASALKDTLTLSASVIEASLSTAGFADVSVGTAAVALGSPSTTTASKSSATSRTTSHVAIMICALAAVMMQGTLL